MFKWQGCNNALYFKMASIPLPKSPPKDDKNVLTFSELLCPGQRPFLVQVKPEVNFQPMMCFPNVAEKIKRDGGTIVHGWEISEVPKIHLEAQFHAVWLSPGGEYIDVTPQLISQSPILFLNDENRVFQGEIVPDQRYALGEPNLVAKYWDLIDQRASMLHQLQLAGFPRGHSVYRERLLPIQKQVEALREDLQRTNP
jgi:hypothetical protein